MNSVFSGPLNRSLPYRHIRHRVRDVKLTGVKVLTYTPGTSVGEIGSWKRQI
jgi:hypothetical protein